METFIIITISFLMALGFLVMAEICRFLYIYIKFKLKSKKLNTYDLKDHAFDSLRYAIIDKTKKNEQNK